MPDRELKVVHFFAIIDQPQRDLYNLRTFSDSTLLYRRADADGDSGWLTTDVDPETGSTVGLDFTAAPAAPTTVVSSSVSATSNDVTLWFDDSPTSAIAGQRFVRQYNISIQQSNGYNFYAASSADLVAFDSQHFSMTDAKGLVKTFGGSKTVNLSGGVYTWSVQVRDLPVFLDESQIPELLQLRDEYEQPVLNYGHYPIVVYDMANTGAAISFTTQLRLANSVYKIEARVQYLPVILSASTSDPYKFSLTDTPPDHINVAATPWSDWSTPLEYTVLPEDQNVLPISKSPGTIDPRPTFLWGANTPNTQYELWIENRATKQRVIHETVTDVHQFQPTTDVPPGQ